MVRFRDTCPPPWFYEEDHNRILVRDGYGRRLLTIHFDDTPMPGKRAQKFLRLSKAEARTLALAIVEATNQCDRYPWPDQHLLGAVQTACVNQRLPVPPPAVPRWHWRGGRARRRRGARVRPGHC
jgi:hypothetical protein